MQSTYDWRRKAETADEVAAFFNGCMGNDISRRVVMVVGNRIAGDARVLKSALSLQDAGFEVFLVGLRQSKRRYAVGRLASVPFVLLANNELREATTADAHASAMCGIASSLTRALTDAEFGIVYTHDFWGLDLGARVVAARAYRQRLLWIHDVHEYIAGYGGVLDPARLDYAQRTQGARIGLPDALVIVNERIRDLLARDHHLPQQDRIVVHNAPRAQRPGSFDVRRACGLTPDVPLGVYLGAATRHRGLDVVIPALREIPELHLALMSNGLREHLDQLTEQAQAAGVDGRLHIFPYVSDDEVADSVKGADFGFSPLTRYGNADLALPTKVLEYLHAGLPVVVSEARFQADFVREHGIGKVFPAGDGAAFAAAIRSVLARPPGPAPAGLTERYSWAANFDSVAARLNALAGADRPPRRGVTHLACADCGGASQLCQGLRHLGRPAQAIGIGETSQVPSSLDALWPDGGLQARASLAVWAGQRFEVCHLHVQPLSLAGQKPPAGSISAGDIGLIRRAGGRPVVHLWDAAAQRRPGDRAASQLADALLAGAPDIQRAWPQAYLMPEPASIDRTAQAIPSASAPLRIAYAVDRPAEAEDGPVVLALRELRKQGLAFEADPLFHPCSADTLDRIRQADVVVDTPERGWYSRLGLQAMALGKAIVAFPDSELARQVPDDVLVRADTQTLADLLRGLIQDPDRRRWLGEAARAHVAANHDCQTLVRALAAFYDGLPESRARPVPFANIARHVDAALPNPRADAPEPKIGRRLGKLVDSAADRSPRCVRRTLARVASAIRRVVLRPRKWARSRPATMHANHKNQ